MNIKIDITGITLKTDRLILRNWALTDLDDFFQYASVDGVGQMAGWPPHKNKEESLLLLKKFINGKNVFAIEFNNKVIGSLGIHHYPEGALLEFDYLKGVEIGYVLSKDYWGQGLMPEAVKAVCDYLFNNNIVDFIVCGHFLDNYQSEKVQFKCGFKHYKIVNYNTQLGEVKKTYISILKKTINNQ